MPITPFIGYHQKLNLSKGRIFQRTKSFAICAMHIYLLRLLTVLKQNEIIHGLQGSIVGEFGAYLGS